MQIFGIKFITVPIIYHALQYMIARLILVFYSFLFIIQVTKESPFFISIDKFEFFKELSYKYPCTPDHRDKVNELYD
jgi:hypothetical protein